MIRLLEIKAIDPHVHLRDFSESHKETLETGTKAALAGGFIAVLDMPNNQPPVLDLDRLKVKLALAQETVFCHYGAFLGAGPQPSKLLECSQLACGLKIYLDSTHGQLLVNDLNTLIEFFTHWPTKRPICVHATDLSLPVAIGLAASHKKRLHVCHISTKEDILLIKTAKAAGLKVTCEVTPHHLLLNEEDAKTLGSTGTVKPPLRSKIDVQALWDNLSIIDCLADDHAPHTWDEKTSSSPPPGFPGLETTLPLMLSAVASGRLSLEKLLDMVWFKPKQIFGIDLPGSYSVIDLEESYFIEDINWQTKAAWSPYSGHRLTGRVRQTFIRGQLVYQDGQFYRPNGQLLMTP